MTSSREKWGGGERNQVKGFVFKADIKRYFENVDQQILLKIINKKIKDKRVFWLIKQVLDNYDSKTKNKGMPLGNYTSQFFANVYLNELDYFVKHKLKARYYIRYVDDFVILHKSKNLLEEYKKKINGFLNKNLKIELHQDKSKVIPIRSGINFLGYKVFYYYKIIKRSNKERFEKKFLENIKEYKEGIEDYAVLISILNGWFGYIKWANTYKYRKKLIKLLEEAEK